MTDEVFLVVVIALIFSFKYGWNPPLFKDKSEPSCERRNSQNFVS